MNRAFIASSLAYILDSLIKSGAVFAAVSFFMYLMRRESASRRFLLAFTGLSLMTLLAVLAYFPGWLRLEEGIIALSYVDPGLTSRAVADGGNFYGGAASSAIVPNAFASGLPPVDGRGLVACVWLAGMALIFLYRLLGQVLLRATLAKAVPVSDERTLGLFRRAMVAFELRGGISLKSGRCIERPFVSGILRPAVYLPPAFADWSDAQTYSILCHELAHVKRSDLGSFSLARILVLAVWFSPFAWLLLRFIRQCREEACDEGAIRAGIRPSAYADSLLSASRMSSASLPFSFVAEAGHGRSLERRIQRTLTPALRASSPLRLTILFSGLLLFVLALAPVRTVWAEGERASAAAKVFGSGAARHAGTEGVRITGGEAAITFGAGDDTGALKHVTGPVASFPLRHPLAGASSRTSLAYGMATNPLTAAPYRHDGIDLAARSGVSVKATMNGTVASAGFDKDYGYYVEIRSGIFASFYAHLAEASPCLRDDAVAAGDSIGKVGSTGYSTGPHLHYEVRAYENGQVTVLDPGPFLEAAEKNPIVSRTNG